IGEDKVTEVVFEEQAGGRIFERHSDGGEGEWGRVLEWEPPRRFVMSWYPGNEPADATELEVRFAPEGEGTRVDLDHRGWERFAEQAAERRSGYDSGWNEVLGYYERSEEHTSELQSLAYLVCRLLLEKKKINSLSILHAA